MLTSLRRLELFLKKNKRKSLVTQEDLNSRLVTANQSLMQQMQEQQQRDTAQTMEQQKGQAEILRKIMGR